MEHARYKLSSCQPAFYHIYVQGHLDATWSESLEDMRIAPISYGMHKPATRLSGLLLDQSALLGVLNTLYTLGLVLLLVEHVDIRQEGEFDM